MKFAGVAFGLCAAAASAGQTTPISKVVQLMSDLQAKVISEGEEAQKVYSEYSEWCEDRARQLGHEIKTGQAESESLKAKIGEETATSASLNAKVDELASAVATDEADLKAATEIRTKEQSDFASEESELIETVDMLKRATAVLEREMSKHGAAFIQAQAAGNLVDALKVMVDASAISSSDASRLTAFVQSQQQSQADADDAEDDAELGAPAADVYKGHSGDIIETLEGLTDKAESQLGDLRKKETANLHNFEMLKQSLSDELKFANKDLGETKKGLAASAEAKSTAEGDLDVTSKELKSDIEAKGELHQSCMTKAEDFEAEVKSRAEELKALAEAKKAIVDATSGAEGVSYSFVQLSSRSALSSGVDLANFEAVRFVRDLARKQQSPELAQLAQRLSSMVRLGNSGGSSDPFGKVRGLIADMITRLESEASADQTKKAYCDKELSETNEKKTDKTAEISKLSTKIDQMSSTSAQLKEEVAELQAALATLAKAQAEMNQLRQTEHEAFVKNKADMEQGLEGVKMALKILNEYYGSKDKAHDAASGAGSSIIGLLEVVESDFSKSYAEVTTAEDTAAAAFDRESKENAIEKTMKEKDVEHKVKESAYLDKEVAEYSTDRSTVQAELDAVLEYLKKIEEQCIAKAETYADRKSRREAEIAGLKEALDILESETALLQRHSATVHRHRAGALRGAALP